MIATDKQCKELITNVIHKKERLAMLYCVTLLMSLFLFSCGTGNYEGIVWDFHDQQDIRMWETINVTSKKVENGFAYFYGQKSFRIISPSSLDIHPKYSILEIVLKTPGHKGPGYILTRTTDGAVSTLRYKLGPSNKFNRYRFDLNKIGKSREHIDGIVLAFEETDSVILDYIKVYNPWLAFLKPYYVNLNSINWIETPSIGLRSFLEYLYVCFLILAVCFAIFMKPRNFGAVMKSIVLSFTTVGIVFALRMDYNWWMELKKDVTLLEKSFDHRMRVIFDERVPALLNPEDTLLESGSSLYYTAKILKRIIPPDEKVRIYAGEEHSELKLKYYLLPILVSRNGNYVIVYHDENIVFDPSKKALKRNGKMIGRNVSLVVAFSKDIQVYRISREI
jgi:hypothetical protein